jgi:DNA mismatch repair protein MutL
VREKLADFFKQQFPEEIATPVQSSAPFMAPQATQGAIAFPAVERRVPKMDVMQIGGASTAMPVPGGGRLETGPTSAASARAPDDGLREMAQMPEARSGQSLQLHNSYLVVQSGEGLEIIDQHALHERILFEEMKERLARGPLESQRMLIPEPVKATPRQMAMVEQIRPVLTKLGIEVAEFGPDTLAVQAFPSFLEKLNPAKFVHELLERGEQEQLDMHEEELLHDVLDMMACKAAVKAGDPLTPGEIEALLARRHLVDRTSNCPHGRPTTLRLSLKDLEKQFKRTGF